MNNSISNNNSYNDKKYTSVYTPYRQLLLVSPSPSSPSSTSSTSISSSTSSSSTSSSSLPIISPSIATSFPSSSSKVYLPFYRQITFPPPPDEIPFLPTIFPESCGFKIVQGAIIGSILGVGLGIFMGAMGDVSPIVVINGKEVPMAPLREQMRGAYKSTMAKSVGWAKNFGILTALFGYYYH